MKVSTGCAWTRSSRRSRPATAERRRRRSVVGYPVICLPGIGCAGSCGPNGVGNATPCGCKRWSRRSARSSRAEGFRQFLLRGLEKVSGEWSLIRTGHNLLKLFRYGPEDGATGLYIVPATSPRSSTRRYRQSDQGLSGCGRRRWSARPVLPDPTAMPVNPQTGC